jgi:hypothetical protein
MVKEAKEIQRLENPRRGFIRVRKTSQYFDMDNPPCEGAVEVETRIIDRRNCDDPRKIPAHNGTDGDWWIKGTNHRIEDGCICRDMGWQKSWFIELSDVMEFARHYGTCVVSVANDGHEEIEIYDDHRE